MKKTVLSSEFLWSYLYVYRSISYKKCYSFPSFQNFLLLCNMCGYCSMTWITLSTLSCSKKAMPVKRGKGNTGTYGIVYVEQSVRNAVCEQRWFQLLQPGSINLGTSHLPGTLPSEFLTVPWTLSNPSRHHSIVISVTLALIHINYSVIACCIMTSARSSCIYSTFLEEMKKTQLDPTSKCY